MRKRASSRSTARSKTGARSSSSSRSPARRHSKRRPTRTWASWRSTSAAWRRALHGTASWQSMACARTSRPWPPSSATRNSSRRRSRSRAAGSCRAPRWSLRTCAQATGTSLATCSRTSTSSSTRAPRRASSAPPAAGSPRCSLPCSASWSRVRGASSSTGWTRSTSDSRLCASLWGSCLRTPCCCRPTCARTLTPSGCTVTRRSGRGWRWCSWRMW
mmetsp:Transcript_41058/g.111004  ORF Transcript_41058/g.111004 Transcript_41058/m.111004 type:complete len:217 (+) Transcript_41058:1403-2053(+)